MKDILNAKGDVIPFIGLGTYPLQGRQMADMIKAAYSVGYRLFDTADDYRGESGIGIAIKEMINDRVCQREDLFLQTKVSDNSSYEDEPLMGKFFNKRSAFMQRHTVDEIVREKVTTSLREMNTDYIDSLLIHLPYPGYVEEIWDSMINLKKQGVVRYIGVSNFHERHIAKIICSGEKPDFNQIYVSPIGTKETQVNYLQKEGITVMTYSPLLDVANGRIPQQKILPIMKKYQKTMAQVVLRWNIERGCLPLPRTKKIIRLEENFDVFNFSLTKEEMNVITSLNMNYQSLPESKICPGL